MTGRVRPIPELSTSAGISNSTRLRDMARAKGVDPLTAYQRFTLEAALRRIFASGDAEDFGLVALKGGALMYFSEGVEPIMGRHTRDVDIEIMPGFAADMDDLGERLKRMLSIVLPVDDGVRFHVDALVATKVKAFDHAVPGGKITCPVQLGGQVHPFTIDVGFHDLESRRDLVVRDYEPLLPKQMETFPVQCQPREYSLADKIQASVRHGQQNTRLRDFYDMTVFFTRTTIDEDLAARALVKTFETYRTPLPGGVEEMQALMPAFVEDNSEGWDAMRRTTHLAVEMPSLQEVIDLLRGRIEPILEKANIIARRAKGPGGGV